MWDMNLELICRVLVSAIVGYAAISWLIRYLQSNGLKLFILYRIAFGAIVIVLALILHLQ